MKSRKKICLIAFCFVMLLALSTCAYAKPSKATVKKAYKKYISENISAPYGGKSYYLDIDRNGIQELFYNKNGVPAKLVICTYKKGKVIKISEIRGGSVSYKTKKKSIRVEPSSLSVGMEFRIYKISGTKMKKTVTYSASPIGYAKNGKMISQKKYLKETKKYNNWKNLF